MTNTLKQFSGNMILFAQDEKLYALFISVVDKIIRTDKIICIPKTPGIILGVINKHGQIIPVSDIRKRFHFMTDQINLEDYFLIASTSRHLLALLNDTVTGNMEFIEDQTFDVANEHPLAHFIKGYARIENNIVLIHNLNKFLY